MPSRPVKGFQLATAPDGVATANINDSAVTKEKIAASAVGFGLTGGAGSAVAIDTAVTATISYVQSLAQGLDIHQHAQVATTVDLGATFSVGLGGSFTNVPNVIDTYTLAVNDRVLVKNQTLTNQNGIYVVTSLGGGPSTAAIQRATDATVLGEIGGSGVNFPTGSFCFVTHGSAGMGTGWVFLYPTSPAPVINTTLLTVTQFSSTSLQVAYNFGQTITETGTPVTINKPTVDATSALALSVTAGSGAALAVSMGAVTTGPGVYANAVTGATGFPLQLQSNAVNILTVAPTGVTTITASADIALAVTQTGAFRALGVATPGGFPSGGFKLMSEVLDTSARATGVGGSITLAGDVNVSNIQPLVELRAQKNNSTVDDRNAHLVVYSNTAVTNTNTATASLGLSSLGALKAILTGTIGFVATTDPTTSADAAFSRLTTASIALGSGAAGDATGVLTLSGIGFGGAAASSGQITGSGATVTTSTPLLNLSQTWNAAVTFTALKTNITDTSSNAASKIADLQVGSSVRYSLYKNGVGFFTDNGALPYLTTNANSNLIGSFDSLSTARWVVANATPGSVFQLATSRGTNASPTSVAANDLLGQWEAAGYIGATSGHAVMARVKFYADGTPTDNTSAPGRIVFQTVPSGSLAGVDRWAIVNAGHLQGTAGHVIGWVTSTTDPTGSLTTGFSRLADDSVALGNGTQGDATGSLRLTTLQAPSATTLNLGGGAASQVTIGSTGAVTVTPTSSVTTLTLVGGTVTTAVSVFDASQTWNNGAQGFTAWRLNITDTASTAGSLIADWQLAGSSLMQLNKFGGLDFTQSTAVTNTPSIITNTTRTATSGTHVANNFRDTFTDGGVASTTVAIPVQIQPTINYTGPGTGHYEALSIGVVETSLPSGTNYLIVARAGVSGTTFEFGVTNTGMVQIVGLISSYQNVTTAGWGVGAIYASGRFTAQSAAVATVATYTPTADGSFVISANINVTAPATGLTATVTYKDENGTTRTDTLPFTVAAGTFTTTPTASGEYLGVSLRIRAQSGTAITVATTWASGTYNVESDITQVR